jgi:hypothetical protein
VNHPLCADCAHALVEALTRHLADLRLENEALTQYVATYPAEGAPPVRPEEDDINLLEGVCVCFSCVTS